MLFCKAADDQSRQYLCCADYFSRHDITEDHPYAKWLIDHAAVLTQYFPRHFQRIIHYLRNSNAQNIIDELNSIREQLLPLAQFQRIDIGQIPTLSDADFWKADWMIKSELTDR